MFTNYILSYLEQLKVVNEMQSFYSVQVAVRSAELVLVPNDENINLHFSTVNESVKNKLTNGVN